MPDLTAIAQALGSLKAAKDIAEAMIGLRDTAAFQGKLIEFQSKLIDANNAASAAQDERSAILERVRELEKQVTDFETWETDKQEYEMKALTSGAIVYALKPEAQTSEPTHYICANCYQHRKRSILQLKPRSDVHRRVGVQMTYLCPEYASEIVAQAHAQ